MHSGERKPNTRNRISRLTQRIEALAERRWGRLTHEELTEEGWAKLKRLDAETPVRDDRQTQ